MREEVASWVKTRRMRVSGDSAISYKWLCRRGNKDIERILEEGGFINRSLIGGISFHRTGSQNGVFFSPLYGHTRMSWLFNLSRIRVARAIYLCVWVEITLRTRV